jgi:regulator of replication initiation timing
MVDIQKVRNEIFSVKSAVTVLITALVIIIPYFGYPAYFAPVVYLILFIGNYMVQPIYGKFDEIIKSFINKDIVEENKRLKEENERLKEEISKLKKIIESEKKANGNDKDEYEWVPASQQNLNTVLEAIQNSVYKNMGYKKVKKKKD